MEAFNSMQKYFLDGTIHPRARVHHKPAGADILISLAALLHALRKPREQMLLRRK
jgi:hypothetical protein